MYHWKLYLELNSYSNSVQMYQFSSVAQSCPILQPHGLQHTRLPCPSPTEMCIASLIFTMWTHLGENHSHQHIEKSAWKAEKLFMLLPWHCAPKNHCSEFYEQRNFSWFWNLCKWYHTVCILNCGFFHWYL